MGGELLSEKPPRKITTYSEAFDELCPLFMAMGMPYEEFWCGHADAVKAYRKAYELKQELENQRLWLQGMYVYDAISRLYPLFNPLTKTRKIEPYVKEPYPLTKKTKEASEVRKAEEKGKQDFEFFKARVAAINARKRKKEEGEQQG